MRKILRRGKVGGYREYFDARQTEIIDAYIDDRLVDVFGYKEQPTSSQATAV